jgi:hypothetical protein
MIYRLLEHLFYYSPAVRALPGDTFRFSIAPYQLKYPPSTSDFDVQANRPHWASPQHDEPQLYLGQLPLGRRGLSASYSFLFVPAERIPPPFLP